jgi:hypothetical protein
MVIASASLLVMAAAVKQMGKAMGTDAGGAGMAGVSLMLIGLAGALYLLGKRAPESTAAAGGNGGHGRGNDRNGAGYQNAGGY